MENFAVAQSVAAKRKRQTYDAAKYERVVTLARQVGADAAANTINRGVPDCDRIPVATIRKWLERWRSSGNFWESAGKRGRPTILTAAAGVQPEWKRQVDALRAQGESVTGRVSSAILRAVLEEKAPSLLERHGGVAKVCVNTGSNLLSKCNMSWRARSSTRIIPPSEVVATARNDFYQSISESFPDDVIDKSLLLNFDQTFQFYTPGRGYTWEKKGADRVQLKSEKDGFTLLPVVSSVGVVGAQMIFGGKSSNVFPRVDPGSLLHFTHSLNHWSNEDTTVQLWRKIILPYIATRRAALGQPSAPTIVLADAFAPHWTDQIKAIASEAEPIAYICIPGTLTHLFQPLDLGIIAAIKQSVLRRKDEFMEKEVQTAVRENRGVILSKSRPILRDKITLFIKECLQDPDICSENCCTSGFRRAGIMRILYDDDGQSPDVDNVLPPLTCDECGELAHPSRLNPPCACFSADTLVTLCQGCRDNHAQLCLV